MRCLFPVVCCFALCLNLLATPITVVTWNTRWLPGGHPNASEKEKSDQMRQEQAIVKALNPDVLVLQEVFDWKAAQQLCSVVPGLLVHTTSNYATRPQNVVVASKFPADSSWWATWKPTLGEDNPPRGYAFAALKLPGDAGFLLTYSVHLKSNLGGIEPNIAAREEGAKQLLAHAAEMTALYGRRGKTSVMIAGDFNSDPADPKFAADHTLALIWNAGYDWVWKGIPRAAAITIPASEKYPAGTFDQIFYRGLELISVKKTDGSVSSDHNPVTAVFR